MKNARVLGFLAVVMVWATIASAIPNDGDAAVHIGPIRWTKDSIADFAVPDAANVVFLASRPDAAILVVDPATGEERSRLPAYSAGLGKLVCSPDGALCMIAGATVEGHKATLLYNVADGQLLRTWDEDVMVWGLSAKLQRACVLMKNGDAPGCALRDLTTGETIKWLDGWEHVWFDEWHNRLYVGTGKWGGEFGSWTVELDATTGEELNKWGLETYGPMCRLKDSDTLLVYGQDPQYGTQAKVIALNVKHGGRIPVINCREGMSDNCLCIGWTMGETRLTLNAEGTRIMLHQLRSNIDAAIIARRFRNQASSSECYLSDRSIMMFGRPIHLMPEFVDDVNNNFYYMPDGLRDGLICRAIGPTLPVPEPGTPTALTMTLDGKTLRVTPPSDAAGEGILSITDMSGRLVLRSVLSLDGRPVSVSVAGLPSGNYLCSLQAGSLTATGKFSVVQ